MSGPYCTTMPYGYICGGCRGWVEHGQEHSCLSFSSTAVDDRPKGWVCPRCGHVYAPHVDECKNCNSLRVTIELGDESTNLKG